jgi:Fe-S-cluster containining protein
MSDQGTITGDDFKCTQCGICCSTQKVVLLTLGDIFRMAERLGMRPGAFYRRYCMKSDRFSDEGLLRIYLKTDGGCPFLKEKRCSIHEYKPVVCALSPFYYLKSSMAVLKVVGVIVPGCSIDRIPYDTVAIGDMERLIDMEIEVSATDDYMREYGKFDEKTARDHHERLRQTLADCETRAIVCQKLLDESLRREDYYRNDPYYRGSTCMYLSGFYREFREEAERMARLHPGLLTFEPAAVGTVGGETVVALHDNDFREAKKCLEGRECDVIFRSSLYSGFEYSTVTITVDGRPARFLSRS